MKKITESFVSSAHLYIMAITLVIGCALSTVSVVKHGGSHMDGSYASFASYGYVPEYAAGLDQQALASQGEQRNPSETAHSNYVQKSIQFAVGAEQQALDPYDREQKQINIGREESERLTPIS